MKALSGTAHADIAPELLIDILRRRSDQSPAKMAVCDRLISLSWSMLGRAVTRGAQRLREAGVRSGDRVLIAFDRSPQFALAYFSVHAAGAVCVLPASDVLGLAARAAAETESTLALTLAGDHSLHAGLGSWHGRRLSVESLCAPGPERGSLPEIGPGDVANIIYTTGSTGDPKGVVLTHSNIAHSSRNICQSLQQTAEDEELCALPLSHSFGLGRLHCMVRAGSGLHLAPRQPAPGDWSGWRLTGMSLTPAGLAILKRIRAEKELTEAGKTLRYVELLGASIDPLVRAWATALLPATRLLHHYGLTEASRAAGLELASPEASMGYLGRAAPGVSFELKDESGQPVPCGEIGELWIRGPIVAQGYWRQPELTARSFLGGSVRTMDLARMDSNGNVCLVGRLSDVINVGGFKVSPEEIESVLNTHPDIEDSACLGIADPAGITGERVAAYLVARRPLTRAHLVEWLRGQGLDNHRIPVHVECVDSLPRTPSGKLLRRQLRI